MGGVNPISSNLTMEPQKMIPEFSNPPFLPTGNHKASISEFIERFTRAPSRQRFARLLLDLFEYAQSVHASSILFGGSFISALPNPNDIDCALLFHKAELIPTVRPTFVGGNGIVDVFFASEDHPDIVASFHKMFKTSKCGQNIGTIEILLGDGERSFDQFPDSDTKMLEAAIRFYGQRHTVAKPGSGKVLVPVHGIRTHAEWYSDISLLGSLGGWTVAPFHYGYQDPTVFVKRGKRSEIVDAFRDHLADICQLCATNYVSVIAHSFGTYIAVNYILGFDDPPTRFDTLILAGAIVDENLDLRRLYGKVGHMLNEVAPNDEWVDWAKRANLATDELFGSAGTLGFAQSSERLIQHRSAIFSHNNVIRRDVIKSRWMPTLEANFGSVDRDRVDIGS